MTDPRDAVIAAARALVASWSGPYPAGIDPEAVIGGREGDLDSALARLDAMQHDRADTPERTATTCAAGRSCTGRDGQPSPLICERCGHCSIHDRDAGCAARTDAGRCGCTGGGA